MSEVISVLEDKFVFYAKEALIFAKKNDACHILVKMFRRDLH